MSLLLIVLQIAVISYALIGGAFLAFSDFIMRSLARTSGDGGVEAMQVINEQVFRWVFMALFHGMAPLSLLIAVYGAVWVDGLSGLLMLASGLIYFIGCFCVTAVCNVPMNNALAGMNLGLASTRDYWTKTYLPRWTFWNSVRAIACTVSAGLLLFALLSLS